MVCASGSLSSSERTKNFLNANGLFYNHDHPFLDFFIQGIDIKAIEIEGIKIKAIEIEDSKLKDSNSKDSVKLFSDWKFQLSLQSSAILID